MLHEGREESRSKKPFPFAAVAQNIPLPLAAMA
jgi:hypothetical protein